MAFFCLFVLGGDRTFISNFSAVRALMYFVGESVIFILCLKEYNFYPSCLESVPTVRALMHTGMGKTLISCLNFYEENFPEIRLRTQRVSPPSKCPIRIDTACSLNAPYILLESGATIAMVLIETYSTMDPNFNTLSGKEHILVQIHVPSQEKLFQQWPDGSIMN